MRIRRPLLSSCIVVLAAWFAGGLLIVPRVITSAYADRSWPILNRMLQGRASHPLSFYLEAWNRAFLTGSILLLVLTVVVLLTPWSRVAAEARAAARRSLAERITAARALIVACAIAALFGLVEALAHVVVSVSLHRPRWGGAGEYYTEGLLWMAPIANTVGYALLAFVVLAALRLRRTRVPVVPWIGGFCALGVYGILRSLFTGLHPAAVLLVSIGVASRMARPGAGLALRARGPRRALAATAVVSLVVLAGVTMAGARRVEGAGLRRAWNVLFIVLDTQRAADMSLYGYHRNTTPHIDALARDAMVFEQAIATAPWTLASHASMFTGHWPSELSTSWDVRLDDEYPTIAELFSKSGWATAGFVANEIYTSPRSGLGRGFQVYQGEQIRPVIVLKNAWFTRNLMMRVLNDPDHTWGRKSAADIRTEFLRWQAGVGDKPFFAFLNFMDTHSPYPAPPPFDTMFSGRRVEERPHMAQRFKYAGKDFAGFVDAYDQSLAYADSEVGKLFETLRRRGVMDSTIVIITADHGEQLGEKKPQLILHGNSLYYSVLHVPLIIRHPGDPRAVGRVQTPVSLRDAAKTVATLANLPDAAVLPGHSLTGFWESANPSASPAIAQLTPIATQEKKWRHWAHAVLAGNDHYIITGTDQEELYDIRKDPWERTDRAAIDSVRVAQLRKLVRETAWR